MGASVKIETVGAIVNRERPGADALTATLAGALARAGLPPVVTDAAEVRARADLVVAIGGDGTILLAARILDGRPTPIWAIHTGGLGFLTETRPEEMAGRLPEVLAGAFDLDERANLHIEVRRAGTVVGKAFALNEVVVGAGDGRIARLSVAVDGAPVTEYETDGLIVATPTGSTAYSLSAGGPIVHPRTEAILLHPLAPHALTHRPLVLPASKNVEVRIESPARAGTRHHVTADGVAVVADPAPGDVVFVRRGLTPTRLVLTRRRDWFAVLRDRLAWGGRRR